MPNEQRRHAGPGMPDMTRDGLPALADAIGWGARASYNKLKIGRTALLIDQNNDLFWTHDNVWRNNPIEHDPPSIAAAMCLPSCGRSSKSDWACREPGSYELLCDLHSIRLRNHSVPQQVIIQVCISCRLGRYTNAPNYPRPATPSRLSKGTGALDCGSRSVPWPSTTRAALEKCSVSVFSIHCSERQRRANDAG
jgi:hypothetical protein